MQPSQRDRSSPGKPNKPPPNQNNMMNAGYHHTTMTEWIGADCPVDFLHVWFPAHWAPIVFRELHNKEVAYRKQHTLWFDDPQVSDPRKVIEQRKDALRSREIHYHIGKLNIDWLDFPVDDILQQFTTLKEGILRGVYSSKLLVLGMVVVQKKPKLRCYWLEHVTSASGQTWWIVCRIVGQKASILAECKLLPCRRQASTSIANIRVLGICGFGCSPIGGCCVPICYEGARDSHI